MFIYIIQNIRAYEKGFFKKFCLYFSSFVNLFVNCLNLLTFDNKSDIYKFYRFTLTPSIYYTMVSYVVSIIRMLHLEDARCGKSKY